MQAALIDDIRSALRDIETTNRYLVTRHGDHQAGVAVLVTASNDDGESRTTEQCLGHVTTSDEALALISRAEALSEKERDDGRT